MSTPASTPRSRTSKSSKRSKGKKKVQEEQIKLFSVEDVLARELKMQQIMSELLDTLKTIDQSQHHLQQIKEERRVEKKWIHYLTCDPVPKPYIPPDIQTFFEKMRFYEAADVETTMDWLLAVDERSILTQDIFRIDKTKAVVRKQLCPEFGKQYDDNIDKALRLIHDIEYYLDDEGQTSKASSRILRYIMDQKTHVQHEIRDMFDRYAYRVLSSEQSYLTYVDPITAEYTYKGNNFDIHLWTLINVPILFYLRDLPTIDADLHQINIKMQLPLSVLEENLTIRGLHLKFDHCTEYAKTYEQEIKVPLENLNAAIPDLMFCLENEWQMQQQMQEVVRNVMRQKRLEYEAILVAIEEAELEKKSKKRDADQKKPVKVPKLPKEPPIVTENTFPDVMQEFLAREQKEYEDFINATYHPKLLNLSAHEINLKRYLILGGIYELYLLVKPRHYTFDTFNMTWHEHKGNLTVLKNTIVDETPTVKENAMNEEELRHAKVRATLLTIKSADTHATMHTRRSSAEIEEELNDFNSPYFILDFKIPEYLCEFGRPMACHFEADVVGFINRKIEDILPTLIPTAEPQTTAAGSGGTAIPVAVESHGRTNPIHEMKSNQVSTQPSPLASRHSFGTAERSSMLTMSARSSGAVVGEKIELDDFRLDEPLTKEQIRNIQRHCLPRVISSLKFPKEFHDIVTNTARTDTRVKAGTIIRKVQATETAIKKIETIFSNVNQTNPERLYPYYRKTEPLLYPKHLDQILGFVRETEPRTFFELIEVLDSIKHLYKIDYQNFWRIQPFLMKTKTRENIRKHLKLSDDPDLAPNTTTSMLKPTASMQSMEDIHEDLAVPETVTITPTKKGKKSGGRHHAPGIEEEEEEEIKYIEEEVKISHWTTEHIIKSEFDRETCTMRVYTNRLGIMGFAFKRYEHFPFRNWSVEPNPENPNKEVVFKIETQYVLCIFYISAEGVRVSVIERPTEAFVRLPKVYLTIEEPIDDFKELKRRLCEKNLNIFSDSDASFYIEHGYFSEKHLACELHTYCCMAINSSNQRFGHSLWNRLAPRRDIIMNFSTMQDEEMNLVHIQPEISQFVDIKELCSDVLEVIQLEYTPTWRNLNFYADLNALIMSVDPTASEFRVSDPNLICMIKEMLYDIRPLSYC